MNEGHTWLLLLLLGLLTACSGAATDATQSAAHEASTAQVGARLYEANCLACHQHNARGLPGVYPSLVQSPVVLGDPQQLARWVIKGIRPSSVAAVSYPTAMPQFGWLKADAAAALLTYIRSHYGNEAPAVDAATVAAALGPES